ncbi:MAG: hypothetical protein ACKO34_07395 [Vampirovibrionales bacterium]
MILWPELRSSEGQSGVKGEHSFLHEQNLRKRLRLLDIHRMGGSPPRLARTN